MPPPPPSFRSPQQPICPDHLDNVEADDDGTIGERVGEDGDGAWCGICLDAIDDAEEAKITTPKLPPKGYDLGEDSDEEVPLEVSCTHHFHKACVKALRRAGVQEVCPMCRAKQPPSPAKLYDDGCTTYFAVRKRVQREDGSWGNFSWRRKFFVLLRIYPLRAMILEKPKLETEEVQMREVLDFWEGAAQKGHVRAQYNLGAMYDDGSRIKEYQQKAVHWYMEAAVSSANIYVPILLPFGPLDPSFQHPSHRSACCS